MEDTAGFARRVLTSLSRDYKHDISKSAVVIFPGQQQLWRVEWAIRAWSARKIPRLWVAGTLRDPFYTRQDVLDEIKRVAGVNHRYNDGDVECGGFANNTLDQAKWVLELLKANSEVTDLVMTTARYHLPRAILTCLKQMIVQDRFARILALPIVHMQGPEFEDSQGLGELQRIRTYQEKGYVATREEWERYLPRIQGL